MRGDGLCSSALDAIGETPLVELGRLFHESEGRVLAKLENLNPSGSRKDRVARQILLDARHDNRLSPHQTVVEMTNGDTGSGLALCCAVLQHPFVAVMSRGNPPERAAMMRAFGAEILLVDQAQGGEPGQVTSADLELVDRVTEQVVLERGAFRADQLHSLANFRAHRLGTGPEILRQSAGRIDAFCDFVGSGGTFAGCAAAFKEYRADLRCYVVEPVGAAVLAGQIVMDPSHSIQGGGYVIPDLELIDPDRIDGYVQVTDEEARQATRDLALKEGLFAGYSSGANLAAARKLLGGPCCGETLVIVIADTGLKYLSTDLWAEPLPAASVSGAS